MRIIRNCGHVNATNEPIHITQHTYSRSTTEPFPSAQYLILMRVCVQQNSITYELAIEE